MVRRSAFTIIELVFAIVIIAISVISLPVMSQVVSKGIDSNLVQEAIFATATKLNEAVTYTWDENSIDPAQPDSLAQTINTGPGVGDCNTTDGQRQGYIPQEKHRKCLSNLLVRPSAVLGSEGGDLDDLDDLAETNAPLFSAAASADGYKENTYTSTITINYANFGTITAASQNIKLISATISDSNGPVTKLNAYSANIGEVDYLRRTF